VTELGANRAGHVDDAVDRGIVAPLDAIGDAVAGRAATQRPSSSTAT
jgi:hypothetical protein